MVTWGNLFFKCPNPSSQAQSITTQDKREVVPREFQHTITKASRIRDFTRMNSPMFFGSQVDEYPQDSLNEVYMILFSMGVSIIEKAEMAACQLKDAAQTLYN